MFYISLSMTGYEGRVPTVRDVLALDVNENDGKVVDEEMVDGPFHRLLAVLVPVDGHRCQRGRRWERLPVIVIDRCSWVHWLW